MPGHVVSPGFIDLHADGMSLPAMHLHANEPGAFVTWHYLDESVPEDRALLNALISRTRVLIASDALLWSFFRR
jgi:hypothetical protein